MSGHWTPGHFAPPASGGGSVATPHLAVADNGDGTGVTATVTDSTAGATNTLYYQAVDGGLGSNDWTAAGSVTGDGTVEAGVPNGFYWWKVISVLGGSDASNLVYRNASDGLAAVQERLLEAVHARVLSLQLPRIESNVFRRKVPWGGNQPARCVVVTSFEETPSSLGGTNAHDDLGRPARLLFIANEAHDADPALEAWWHLCQQRLFRAFNGQRVPGVAECAYAEVEFGPQLALDESIDNYQFGVVTVRARTREPRGLGA